MFIFNKEDSYRIKQIDKEMQLILFCIFILIMSDSFVVFLYMKKIFSNIPCLVKIF